MDALDVAKVCVRRWYVCVPVIAVALLAGMQMTSGRVPSYSATGSFALIYTHAGELRPNEIDPRIANPLVAGGPALLKEALVSDLSSAQTQQEIGRPGVSGAPPASVTVGQNVVFGGAFSLDSPRASLSTVITAYGTDPVAVRETVVAALAAVPARLTKIQNEFNAPPKSQYTSFITAAPQMAQYPPQSRMKALIALGGVGALAGAALALLVDRLLTRRRLRREMGDGGSGRKKSQRRRREDSFVQDEESLSLWAERSLT